MTDNKPTIDQFNKYQELFDILNERLFHGDVPSVILNFSRKAHTYGFFSPDRWSNGDTNTHEISLNPDKFDRDFRLVLSTLAHEMCHLWQHACGVPSRGRYHNREWGAKMKEIGLYPSDTGKEGGIEVGDKVSHYIIEGGAYDTLYKEFENSAKFPWLLASVLGLGDIVTGGKGIEGTEGGVEGNGKGKKRVNSKVKYSCPACNANVWGKSGLAVTCTLCNISFVESEGK